tara:strand:- start:18536 stop:18868 length:333 start_codon:yes stop_codon:yes gene_type:complete
MKFLNWINSKWNNFIFYIHDLTAKWGIGHTTVWLYDNLTWTLPEKWQMIAGKTNEQYLLEHELYIARHQAQYYANLAYEYQGAWLEAILPEEEEVEEVINKDLKKKEKQK